MKWEMLMKEVDGLIGRSNKTLWERVIRLVKVWEDADFLAYHRGNMDRAMDHLDGKLGDYGITFGNAMAILDYYPKQSDWAEHSLRTMLAESLTRKEDERRKATTNVSWPIESPEKIVEDMASEYKDDIDTAVSRTINRFKKLKTVKKVKERYLEMGVRRAILDWRHQQNQSLREAKDEGSESYLDYLISGKTLGAIRGKELEILALQEDEKAKGCVFNARLLRKLAPLIPPGKTVKKAIDGGRIREIIKELRGIK